MIRSKQSRGRQGAVLAEFAVAIMPLLLAFFVFWQVAIMVTAKMIVRHAAIVGARSAAVITGGGATNPGKGGTPQGTDADVKTAVTSALGVWGTNGMLSSQTNVSDSGGTRATVTVTVTATFQCNTPLGRNFVCGGGGTLTMTDSASMPKEGADYK